MCFITAQARRCGRCVTKAPTKITFNIIIRCTYAIFVNEENRAGGGCETD